MRSLSTRLLLPLTMLLSLFRVMIQQKIAADVHNYSSSVDEDARRLQTAPVQLKADTITAGTSAGKMAFDWSAYLHYNPDLVVQGIRTEAEALSHFLLHGRAEGRRYSKAMPGMENFDWRAYLELNPDLVHGGVVTENQAFDHYRRSGKDEGRQYTRLVPDNADWSAGLHKMQVHLDNLRFHAVPLQHSNLILYHLEDPEFSLNSAEVTYNNAKVFGSSMALHTEAAEQKAFYWINAIGVNENPMLRSFPVSSANVAVVRWKFDSSDLNTHLLTLHQLGTDVTSNFSAIFFTGTGMRGPFTMRSDGAWLSAYRNLLDHEDSDGGHVGMVGASISCRKMPHVQTHFFGLRSAVIPHLLRSYTTDYEKMQYFVSALAYFEMMISLLVQNEGYKLSSMLSYKRLGMWSYGGNCANDSIVAIPTNDWSASSWCAIRPETVIFMRWSGESLGARRYLCGKSIATSGKSIEYMQNAMISIAASEPGLDLVFTEALTGGMLYDLYKAYSTEVWLDRNRTVHLEKQRRREWIVQMTGDGVHRNDARHGEVIALAAETSDSNDNGLKERIKFSKNERDEKLNDVSDHTATTKDSGGASESIDHEMQRRFRRGRRKSEPYATADALAFGSNVGRLVDSEARAAAHHALESREPRVCFLVRTDKDSENAAGSVKFKSRFNFLKMDVNGLITSLLRQSNNNWEAFFIAERGLMRKRLRDLFKEYDDPRLTLLSSNEGLDWSMNRIQLDSLSRLDEAIASLKARPECRWLSVTDITIAYGSEVVDKVLKASSMKNQNPSPDLVLAPLDSRMYPQSDFELRQEHLWDHRCTGIEAMLRHNQLAYTAQPIPVPGKVEFAAAFFSREKFISDSIRFDNFSKNIGNFTLRVRSGSCKFNCQDGLFMQHLVRNRLWTYKRLALDNLKSIVFSGPSPTLCIAAGNVWLDFPDANQVGCLSHKTLQQLQQRGSGLSAFDWLSFRSGERVCLRLSQYGFFNQALLSPRKIKKGSHDSVLNNLQLSSHEQALSIQRKEERSTGSVLSDTSNVFSTGTSVLHRENEEEDFLRRRRLQAAKLNSTMIDQEVLSHDTKMHVRQLRQKPTAAEAAQAAASALGIQAVVPMDFDWRTYLQLNRDLQTQGILSERTAVEHYLVFGAREGRRYFQDILTTKEFDWRAYLELNQDVLQGQSHATELMALKHFKMYGQAEERPFMKITPSASSWDNAWIKLQKYLDLLDEKQVPVQQRTLVIFHVESVEVKQLSLDVVRNNMKLFVAAVAQHDSWRGDVKAFYWFNVVGMDRNPLAMEIPHLKANVAQVDWEYESSDLNTHLRTLTLMGSDTTSRFNAIFFSSTGVRGPLIFRKNGDWITQFRRLLDDNDVGIVGPTISCRGTPYVQTHAFMIRSGLVPLIMTELDRYYGLSPWQPLLQYFDVELSSIVRRAGLHIASLLTHKRLQQHFYDGFCTNGSSMAMPATYNRDEWCKLMPQEVLFMRWGGEAYGADRYLCGKAIGMDEEAIGMMHDTMVDIATVRGSNEPKMNYILPETPVGGHLYDLYRQYREEMWLDRLLSDMPMKHQRSIANTRGITEPKVCFLVRTASVHDPAHAVKSKFDFLEMDLVGLIASLIRQVNPNWEAYFFITDHVPFEHRLKRILNNYGDSRLIYMSIDHEHRPAFSKADAGYTATDYVLEQLRNKRSCDWLSVTNADNVYGSEVVDRVLNVAVDRTTLRRPDMLLNPLDSRNFAEQDYQKRAEGDLSVRCLGIEAMLNNNLLTYTVQPLPILGRVDLAAVFFSRERLAHENILFGNFSDQLKYACKGCQDGYLTQFLVRKRRWTYERLEIDGLKSIIFHGPSPTLCIAGGNVWFDYPHVNKVGCFTHRTTQLLKANDENAAAPTFDWEHFYRRGMRCLRLSKSGFLNKASEV